MLELSHPFQTTIIKHVELSTAIEIEFTFPQGEEGISCPITWSPPSGTLRVKISAKDLLSNCDEENSIDPFQLSIATISHSRGNITVTFDNNQITISRIGSNSYNGEVSIEIPSAEEIVSIKMPEIITDIYFENFQIRGEARFLT